MDMEQVAREEIIELCKFLVSNSKKQISYFPGKPMRPFKWRYSEDNQSICLVGGELVIIDILVSHFPKDETYGYSLWEHRASHADGNMSELDRIDQYGIHGYSKLGNTNSGVKMDFKEMLKDIEEDINKIEEIAQENEESMEESIIVLEHDVRIGKFILEAGEKIRILGEEEKKKMPWDKDEDEKDDKKDSDKK